MERVTDRFNLLQRQQRKGLIPFIVAGHPAPNITVPLMHILVKAGADIIELGIPFSDPMADGPVIQRASECALEQGVSLAKIIKMVEKFRQQDQQTPIILMGYLNPIEAMGYREFVQQASEAGIDGILVVDMPVEEAGELTELLQQKKLVQIFLLSPTTTNDRLAKICAVANGFLYYVSLKGVTGSHRLDVATVADAVKRIRNYSELPIGVGFGIDNPQDAAKVAEFSDAVVIGSAVVKRMIDISEQSLSNVTSFLKSIRQGIDNMQKTN